jgi:DNA-binding transcriptional LysR family regulator
MDKIKLMATYIQVAQSGSFAAAADKLRVSRGVATKHVAHLERHLGVTLLHRTTRQLKVTEVGQAYLDFCVRTLRDIDQGERELGPLQDTPRGAIKVVSTKAFASINLGHLVGEFSIKYPAIEVSARVTDAPMDQVKMIEDGIDLIIRLTRPSESSHMIRRVCGMHWVACASPHYLRRVEALHKPDDLTRANCLVHTRLTPDGLWRFHRAGRENAVKVSGSINSNAVLVLRACAIAGAGIALLPNYCVVEDIVAGRLIRVLPDFEGPSDEIFILFPSGRSIPKRVRLFIDFLIEKLRSPAWDPVSKRGRRDTSVD